MFLYLSHRVPAHPDQFLGSKQALLLLFCLVLLFLEAHDHLRHFLFVIETFEQLLDGVSPAENDCFLHEIWVFTHELRVFALVVVARGRSPRRFHLSLSKSLPVEARKPRMVFYFLNAANIPHSVLWFSPYQLIA